jgi:hypothetical protein
MRVLAIILLSALTSQAATTWYVRPSVSTTYSGSSPNGPVPTAGVYGSQNGTSYANAWNGLNSVVFGGAGVQAGDALYVCGSHIYTLSNINNFPTQARVPVTVSGFTIRMDYTNDPGLVFGGAINQEPAANVWLGPDVNGVYWSTNTVNGSHYPTPFQVVGTNITRLNTQLTETWVGNPGSWYYTNNTNFVKTSDNSNPAGKIAFQTFGWTFDLGKQSNIVFLNCTFFAASRPTGGGVFYDTPTYAGFIGANHIYWTNCLLSEGSAVALYPGNDYWIYDSCEIGNATYGIYGFYDSQTRGPNAIKINNCYIHDIDTTNYPDEGGDGHGIGARDTSNWVVTGNRLERTAAAIDFFVDNGWYRTNNLIEHNFVKDVRLTHPIGTVGTGGGILFEGGTTAGLSISNRINGNILLNIGVGATEDWQGEAIGAGGIDYIQILNNTISNSHSGITISSTTPLNAKVENNIIVSPEFRYIDFVGTGAATNLTLDYNLYYPIGALTNQFRLFPSETHDVHSVFANPNFVSPVQTTARNFKLKTGSAAISAGTLVGLATDFSGVPIPVSGAPDIGAFQYGYLANSCSMADVQAAVNGSVAGDIVLIPAGTCTWTTNVSKPGVGFVGAGIDTTMIVDEVPRMLANKQVFIMSGTNWQLSGLTVTGSLAVTTINYDGALRVSGEDWRIHDMKMVNLYAIGGVIRARRGLVDHCTFRLPVNETFQVYDADTFGYASWNTAVVWGSTNFVRMQDNLFADNSAYPALDFYGGARVDISHNVFTNTSIGNHGTDSSGAIISCRAMDVHSNLFIFPPGTASSPWPFAIYMRGGTARVWNNKFQGRYTVAVRADVYRRYLRGEVEGSPGWTPWGGVTGSNVWDGNTDSLGYPALHSIGRGQGDLLAGNPPVNVTRGSIRTWTHDALDPVYCWSNSLSIDPQPDGTNEMRTSTALVIPGRDYYVATADPAYTGPLIYPDPLITGVNPPSPTLPPLPATNLRIISVQQANGVILLAWDASPTGTVNNYSFYVSNTSNNYGGGSAIGNVTSVTVSNLDLNKSWFFAVTATDGVTGLESAYSTEVEFDPAPVTKNYATGNGNLFLGPLGFGQW